MSSSTASGIASQNGTQQAGKTLQAILYRRGSLKLLDQRKLPLESTYTDIPNATAGWEAIKEMVVRGAPAIAIAAALALAVEVTNQQNFDSGSSAATAISERLDYLVTSRPTAVNLADAAGKLKVVVSKAAEKGSPQDVVEAYVAAAEAMLTQDVADNKAIGEFGAGFILKGGPSRGLRLLTHCNTGSLATAEYGTALGVIRNLFAKGSLERAFCTETRPYNQGARLTAYELVYENIPATLIADSAAAALLASGQVDAVVVGADRIAGNGDTANKVGTYSLAVSCRHHGVPFFVAAPLTSVDLEMPSGQGIVIEERTPRELTHALGGQGPQVAPDGINVWNPAFDVAPAALITAIFTDKGVAVKPEGSSVFDLPSFVRSATGGADKAESAPATGADEAGQPAPVSGFDTLNEASCIAYVERIGHLAQRLGGSGKDWTVREVGDGNLNFVYILEGPAGALVLKQSVPYIRCIGPSWPMTSDRSFYEVTTLLEHRKFCQDHVPEVYHSDRPRSVIAMRYLAPPHLILRKGLIAGTVYPLLATHMSDYLARTLFFTSLLKVDSSEFKAGVAKYCGNVEMCRLTEQVVFTDPYYNAPMNRWTSPQLDRHAQALRDDTELKCHVAALKSKFVCHTQALIHGDLHTGSIMVTQDSTQVIDPEFAFYGPMGFDLGAFLGNLFLAYLSQEGHAKGADDRRDCRAWIAETAVQTWELFSTKFLDLWNEHASSPGDAYTAAVYNIPEALAAAQKDFMAALFQDTLGFAGAKMIRRIVGVAHVEDFESIADPDARAKCERRALDFAKDIIKRRSSLLSIREVVEKMINIA